MTDPVDTLMVTVILTVRVNVPEFRSAYGGETRERIADDVRASIADAARYALAEGIEAVDIKRRGARPRSVR